MLDIGWLFQYISVSPKVIPIKKPRCVCIGAENLLLQGMSILQAVLHHV